MKQEVIQVGKVKLTQKAVDVLEDWFDGQKGDTYIEFAISELKRVQDMISLLVIEPKNIPYFVESELSDALHFLIAFRMDVEKILSENNP